MACDYCSTDDDDRACMCGPEEMCGDCFESRVQPEDVPKILEAMARKPSPTVDLNPTCECGHPLAGHGFGPRCIGNRNLCPCLGFRTPEPKAPERSLYGCCTNTQCMCLPAQCHCEQPEEPPLTPEEEEQAPCAHESWDVTGEWGEKAEDDQLTGKWWKSRRCNDCGEDLDNVLEDEPHWDFQPVESPPQPDRRPPYAVAYSVQGHLFEVALPGDASVKAVDGALVIQHHLGPVAGICQVLPVINEKEQG